MSLTIASSANILKVEPVPILKQIIDVGYDGNYHNAFQTGNGIILNEHGLLKNRGIKDEEAAEVLGSVSYTAPDGTPVHLRYIANEKGYIAQGTHVPVAPPIPRDILRALKWIAEHRKPLESVGKS